MIYCKIYYIHAIIRRIRCAIESSGHNITIFIQKQRAYTMKLINYIRSGKIEL